RHNLFTHPTEATITINAEGYEIENLLESQCILDILEDLDYNVRDIQDTLNDRIEESGLIGEMEKKRILGELYLLLNDNGYLKTVSRSSE
ncbi:MAG: arginine decarboxylase, partial [Campylobacteraceae bacterium]|nr:arginine decarboxylase [Campylobacteraceae bacterium]